MTEALEFKHSSTSLANSSRGQVGRDQSSILENDKDTVSDAMPNGASNMSDTTMKKNDANKVNLSKQSTIKPASVLIPTVGDGDLDLTSKPPQESTPPLSVPKSQHNAPKPGPKKK
jgi:ABC-type Na+ efflux pump permease subunit